MIDLILHVIMFLVFAGFIAIFTHPFIAIALMILWVWVRKECRKYD